MNDQNRHHLMEVRLAHERRLQILEKQAAALGLHAPPHVLTEIEDIRTQLDAIDAELAQESSLQPDDDSGYDLAAVRGLLLAAFNAEELRSFLYFRPRFRSIVDSFGPSQGLNDRVDQTIEYSERKCLLEELLREVEDENPAQYQRWAPHLQQVATDD